MAAVVTFIKTVPTYIKPDDCEIQANNAFIHAGLKVNRFYGLALSISPITASALMVFNHSVGGALKGAAYFVQFDFKKSGAEIGIGALNSVHSIYNIVLVFSTALLGLIKRDLMYSAMKTQPTQRERDQQEIDRLQLLLPQLQETHLRLTQEKANLERTIQETGGQVEAAVKQALTNLTPQLISTNTSLQAILAQVDEMKAVVSSAACKGLEAKLQEQTDSLQKAEQTILQLNSEHPQAIEQAKQEVTEALNVQYGQEIKGLQVVREKAKGKLSELSAEIELLRKQLNETKRTNESARALIQKGLGQEPGTAEETKNSETVPVRPPTPRPPANLLDIN